MKEYERREQIEKLLTQIVDYAFNEIAMTEVKEFLKNAMLELLNKKLIKSNLIVKSHDNGFAYSLHCMPNMPYPTEISKIYRISQGRLFVKNFRNLLT